MAALATQASGSTMSERTKAPTTAPGQGDGDAAAGSVSREKESGRVAFDTRGDAVWEWRAGDGKFQRDASTSLVRKLEAHDLSLEATVIARKRYDDGSKKSARSCGGFDPYDNAAARTSAGRAAARPVPARQPPRPPVMPQRTEPGLLHRLTSWMGRKGPSRSR
jgi:hypothetical protein